MRTLIATLLVLISSITLLAGTRSPSVPDEKYLKYGEDFHYVLSICGIYNDDSLFCASAVIIQPRWILTAAHVVKDVKHCGIQTKNGVVIIEKTFIHKDFETKLGIGDIALCYLKRNVELDFYPPLYTENDEVGKICSIAGFGLTGTFLNGAKESDGKRRAGSNKIDMIFSDLLICTPSQNSKDGLTSLEFLIASGDSGGGLFIDEKLAGINSCVMAKRKSPNSKYDDESGHTRVSKFVPWILETIKTESVEE